MAGFRAILERMRASPWSRLLFLQTARSHDGRSPGGSSRSPSARSNATVEGAQRGGVPIYAERGPHGGIHASTAIARGGTGLTGDEAEALFLSYAVARRGAGIGTVVAAARLKVLAALPSELRVRASRLVERFHLDAAGWFHASEPVPHLALLADAVWEARRLAITYRRGDSEVERSLEPLGLVLKAGVWYLVAASEGQVRTYRVSRIRSATVGDDDHATPIRPARTGPTRSPPTSAMPRA